MQEKADTAMHQNNRTQDQKDQKDGKDGNGGPVRVEQFRNFCAQIPSTWPFTAAGMRSILALGNRKNLIIKIRKTFMTFLCGHVAVSLPPQIEEDMPFQLLASSSSNRLMDCSIRRELNEGNDRAIREDDPNESNGSSVLSFHSLARNKWTL